MRLSFFLILLALLTLTTGAQAESLATSKARVIRVGKGLPLDLPSQAAKVARDGDIVEIEAGDYHGDVAVWTQRSLTLRGVHGRARLFAAGNAAEGKAIWVIRDGHYVVENLEFIGTRVADRNGAGLRFEAGHLTVRNCLFRNNEMGLLTANDENAVLEVDSSEFHHNGYQDNAAHHSLYVGKIAQLKVQGSYFHHGIQGHLVKSRARLNHISHSRLTDELGGSASYELEFPNGGVAYVIGNIVQQSSTSENPYIISFGVEGYGWKENALFLVNNTLVDEKPRNGVFLRVSPGAQQVVAFNNLLIGQGELDNSASGSWLSRLGGSANEKAVPPGKFLYAQNFHGEWQDLAQASRYDYRLRPASRLVGRAIHPKELGQADTLHLTQEYLHPLNWRTIPSGTPYSPGALQTLAP